MHDDGATVLTVGTPRRIRGVERARLAAKLTLNYERGATLAQLSQRTGDAVK